MKTNKIILRILLLLFLLSLTFAFACVEEDSDKFDLNSDYSIRLDETSIVIDMLFDKQLRVETRKDGVIVNNATVVWESSNESIVKVDDGGRITPIMVGNAVVTASWQKQKATCIVDVRQDTVPTLIVNPKSLGFVYGVSEPFKLETKVYYKGEYLNSSDIVITYSLPVEQNVVSVDKNGVVTPNKIGSTILTVSAEYNGYKSIGMTIEIPINVYKDIEMYITPNGYRVENIYLNNFLYEGVEYKNNLQFDYIVKVPDASGNFIVDNDAEVVWKTSDDSVAQIDANGKLQAIRSGEINVWYEYVYGTDIYRSSEIQVKVNKYLLVDKTDSLSLYAKSKNEEDSPFIPKKVFGNDFGGDIVGIYYQGKNIYANGKANYQSFSDGDYVVTVENSEHYAYKLNFSLVTNIDNLTVKPVGFYLYNNDTTDRGYGTLSYGDTIEGKTAYITGTKSTGVANNGAFFCQYKFDVEAKTVRKWIDAGYTYVQTDMFISAPNDTVDVAILNDDMSRREMNANQWLKIKINLADLLKYVSLSSGAPYLSKIWTGDVGEYSVSYTNFTVVSGEIEMAVANGSVFYSYNSTPSDRGYGKTYIDYEFQGKTAVIGGTKTTGVTDGNGIFSALWKFSISDADVQRLIDKGVNYICMDIYLIAGNSAKVDLAYLSDKASRKSYDTGKWQKFYIDIDEFRNWLAGGSGDPFFLRIWNAGVTGEYAIYIADIRFVKEK